jgi:RNA polymerase sigma-70 factor (sigma-E family)
VSVVRGTVVVDEAGGGGKVGVVAGGPSAPAGWAPDLLELYTEFRLPMLRLAVLLTDDPAAAEDVVHDAFIAVQRRWASVDPAAARGYLRVAVVNTARSVVRRTIVARRHRRGAEPEAGPAADDGLVLAEEHREVWAAVRSLPRRQREVLVLRYWSGLSEEQIASALGVSRGTVKSTASRGLDAVQKMLGELS